MHSRASSLPPLGSQSSLAFLRSASTNLRAPLPCSSSRIGSAVNVKSSPTGPTGKFISRRNSGASLVAVARGQPSPDRSFCLTDCPRKALRNDIIAETKRPVEGACAIYPQVSHSFSTPARPLATLHHRACRILDRPDETSGPCERPAQCAARKRAAAHVPRRSRRIPRRISAGKYSTITGAT